MSGHKQFRMTPELWLQLGPDHQRHARMGPLPWASVCQMLRFATPHEAELAARAQASTEIKGSEDALNLFSEALYDWNSTFADDEDGEQYHSTKGWVWCGFAIKGETESVSVWVSIACGYCSVDTRQGALDSQARSAALAAYEALLPLVKPESDGR